MTTKPLTPAQEDAMRTLANYAGQTVSVQTSQYHVSGRTGQPLYPDTWKPVDIIGAATLRGLQARGLIKITASFWRGATIEVVA